MRAAPGSTLWLLRHELRLAWFGTTSNKAGRRRPGVALLVAWSVGTVALHLFAWNILSPLADAGLDASMLAVGAGAVVIVCGSFMLSTALRSSVMALFERGDLDLLLSSPLPSRSIFAVRLLGVIASAVALFLYLFAPFANVALFLGRPGWLAIYPALCAVATLASCLAMLLTLGLVRWLGARRTRVLAQVLAAIAGGLLFLLSQGFNMMSHGRDPDAGAHLLRSLARHGLLAPGSVLWSPGRAALGGALPLAVLVALAIGAFMLTVGRTHRFFAHGLQQAAGAGHAAARPVGPVHLRVRASLFDAIVLKEWRLIARDPHLISQVLLQLVYLLPLFLLIFRDAGAPGPALASGLTLLSASLAGSLAWIVSAAEDAPDLLLAAPAPGRTIRLAKMAAGAMPPIALVALPLSWLIVRSPVAGLLVCFTVTASVLSATLIVSWVGRPAPRSDFKGRGRENFLCSMLEFFNSAAWACLGWLLVSMAGQAAGTNGWTPWATLTMAGLGLATPLLAWLLRRRAG